MSIKMTATSAALITSKQQQNSMEPQCDAEQQTPVNQMFQGRSVFITGASGFIGRVLLEKLLRCYQGIKNVYILMRSKKNMSPNERLHRQLLKVPIFDQIRSLKNGQELLDKIIVITGDIGEEQLGISDTDLATLLGDSSLSIVFHAAATVKFDEPLHTSVRFNLEATQAVINLCQQMSNLIALCHVSTAYVNSDIKNNSPIEETLYPIGQDPSHVIKLSHWLDEELLSQIKPALIAERPNTYTYTKALAEHLIALEGSNLPVAIVRPSIVVSAWKEPIPGWVDNLNGPTGLILAIGKGLLRSMYARGDCKADIIPVDIVVNTMIASSYYAAKSSGKLIIEGEEEAQVENSSKTQVSIVDKHEELITKSKLETKVVNDNTCRQVSNNNNNNNKRVPPVFHCTSGEINPITWGLMERFFPIIRQYPSRQVFRYPFGTFKRNKYHDFVTRLVVHYLPALVLDFICLIMGKKRQLVSIYYKLHCAVAALSHFTSTNYNFKMDNMKQLQACLKHPKDQDELYMDITTLKWDQFWATYVMGARRYVLKEDDESLEEAHRSFKRAYYLEMAFRTLLTIFAFVILRPYVMPLVSSAAALFSNESNFVGVS